MHPRILFLLALRASARRFQIPLKGLNFGKTLVTFGIIYATDPLLQIRLRSFASVDSPSIFLTTKLLQTVLNFMGQFYEISIVYHTLYLRNEDGDPQFFLHFWHR